MVDPDTLQAACCSIGSVCGSPCNETQYECNATTTKVLTRTPTDTVSGAATLPVVTTTTTTSVYAACCARRCPGTGQFACASSFGGGCCSFGQNCASSSQCIWVDKPTSTRLGTNSAGTATGLVSALPSGCTTNQVACPSSLGGGCCALGNTCTVVTDQVFCAPMATGGANGTITTDGDDGGGGLSAGAKAGIALGVVVGAGALIGAATWVCLRKRRRRDYGGATVDGSSAPPGSYGTPDEADRPPPPMSEAEQAAAGLGASRSWRRPRYLRRNTGASSANNSSSGGGAAGGTAGSVSDIVSRASGSRRLPGQARDYVGPDAVVGPYTTLAGADGHGMLHPHSAAVGAMHGVPMEPHGPNDIVAPVEIDSWQRPEAIPMGYGGGSDPNSEKSDGTAVAASVTPAPEPQELPAEHHYELYGSEVPAPMPAAQQQVASPNEGPAESLPPAVVPSPLATPLETQPDSTKTGSIPHPPA